VLQSILSPEVYGNFLILPVAITILSQRDVSPDLCDYADYLLTSFVQHVQKLHGKGVMV